MDVLDWMRSDWEQRALDDPLHYIATDKRDLAAFDRSAAPDVAQILAGVPTGGRVLEIGAGIGRLLVAMEDRFDELVGVDISPRMVELSRDYLATHPTVNVLLNDGASLPFEDRSFGFVFSYITFQHIPERAVVERYVSEAHRVLAAGGVFRFQVIERTLPQRLLRPLRLDKPTTWKGYNWTRRGLAAALQRSPFRGGTIAQRPPYFLWATAQRS